MDTKEILYTITQSIVLSTKDMFSCCLVIGLKYDQYLPMLINSYAREIQVVGDGTDILCSLHRILLSEQLIRPSLNSYLYRISHMFTSISGASIVSHSCFLEVIRDMCKNNMLFTELDKKIIWIYAHDSMDSKTLDNSLCSMNDPMVDRKIAEKLCRFYHFCVNHMYSIGNMKIREILCDKLKQSIDRLALVSEPSERTKHFMENMNRHLNAENIEHYMSVNPYMMIIFVENHMECQPDGKLVLGINKDSRYYVKDHATLKHSIMCDAEKYVNHQSGMVYVRDFPEFIVEIDNYKKRMCSNISIHAFPFAKGVTDISVLMKDDIRGNITVNLHRIDKSKYIKPT